MKTLAIDIGGTKLSLAVFDGERMIRRETRVRTSEGEREWILSQIVEAGRVWSETPGFSLCGIGFGGPVVFREQRVALSTHVGGWADFRLPFELEREFGVACVMDNDANLGALGEAVYGAGVGHDPLFYLTLSTGIGGGLVVSGEVYRGADSWAGEIGHTIVRPGGPACLCGARGCLERLCSGLWIERDHGAPAKVMLEDAQFLAHYVRDLAAGLKTCVMLLNPARIVIGGGIAKMGRPLFDALGAELRHQITAWSGARLDLAPAALVDDSVLYGALVLARRFAGVSG
jgi:glucokinase